MGTIIQFPISDNAFLEFWSVHCISVISSCTLVWPYMENNDEIFLGQSGKVDFASFLPTKQQKKTKQKQKMPYRQRQMKLFHEIISFHISWRPRWKPSFSHDQWFWELNLCCYKPSRLFWFPPVILLLPLKRKPRYITKHLMSGPLGNQLVLFSLGIWH